MGIYNTAANSRHAYRFRYDYAGRCYQRDRLVVDAGGDVTGSIPEEYYIYDGAKKIAVLQDVAPYSIYLPMQKKE